jgi:hypothetical protein
MLKYLSMALNSFRNHRATDNDKQLVIPVNGANPPTDTQIRACIDADMCWWCGRGPWVSLAAHTYKAHGHRAHDLRELAGLDNRARVCSLNYSRKCAIRIRNQFRTIQRE